MSQLTNPYASTKKTDLVRLQTNISRDDYNFIRSIRPQKGTVEFTINQLWYKLTQTLKANGITSYTDYAAYEQLVQNCHIVLSLGDKPPRRTPRRTVDKTSRHSNGGGNAGVCTQTTSIT